MFLHLCLLLITLSSLADAVPVSETSPPQELDLLESEYGNDNFTHAFNDIRNSVRRIFARLYNNDVVRWKRGTFTGEESSVVNNKTNEKENDKVLPEKVNSKTVRKQQDTALSTKRKNKTNKAKSVSDESSSKNKKKSVSKDLDRSVAKSKNTTDTKKKKINDKTGHKKETQTIVVKEKKLSKSKNRIKNKGKSVIAKFQIEHENETIGHDASKITTGSKKKQTDIKNGSERGWRKNENAQIGTQEHDISKPKNSVDRENRENEKLITSDKTRSKNVNEKMTRKHQDTSSSKNNRTNINDKQSNKVLSHSDNKATVTKLENISLSEKKKFNNSKEHIQKLNHGKNASDKVPSRDEYDNHKDKKSVQNLNDRSSASDVVPSTDKNEKTVTKDQDKSEHIKKVNDGKSVSGNVSSTDDNEKTVMKNNDKDNKQVQKLNTRSSASAKVPSTDKNEKNVTKDRRTEEHIKKLNDGKNVSDNVSSTDDKKKTVIKDNNKDKKYVSANVLYESEKARTKNQEKTDELNDGKSGNVSSGNKSKHTDTKVQDASLSETLKITGAPFNKKVGTTKSLQIGNPNDKTDETALYNKKLFTAPDPVSINSKEFKAPGAVLLELSRRTQVFAKASTKPFVKANVTEEPLKKIEAKDTERQTNKRVEPAPDAYSVSEDFDVPLDDVLYTYNDYDSDLEKSEDFDPEKLEDTHELFLDLACKSLKKIFILSSLEKCTAVLPTDSKKKYAYKLEDRDYFCDQDGLLTKKSSGDPKKNMERDRKAAEEYNAMSFDRKKLEMERRAKEKETFSRQWRIFRKCILVLKK